LGLQNIYTEPFIHQRASAWTLVSHFGADLQIAYSSFTVAEECPYLYTTSTIPFVPHKINLKTTTSYFEVIIVTNSEMIKTTQCSQISN